MRLTPRAPGFLLEGHLRSNLLGEGALPPYRFRGGGTFSQRGIPIGIGIWVDRALVQLATSSPRNVIKDAASRCSLSQPRGHRQGLAPEPLDPTGCVLGPSDDRRDSDSVRRVRRPWGDSIGGSPQESRRPRRVATLCMGDAYRKLGESTPEIAFNVWRRLPRTFEDFVGAERATLVKQSLGLGQRIGGWQRRFIRQDFTAGSAVRQRPAVPVARARIARSPGGIPIALVGHRQQSYEGPPIHHRWSVQVRRTEANGGAWW